jgi:hypothetical protein
MPKSDQTFVEIQEEALLALQPAYDAVTGYTSSPCDHGSPPLKARGESDRTRSRTRFRETHFQWTCDLLHRAPTPPPSSPLSPRQPQRHRSSGCRTRLITTTPTTPGAPLAVTPRFALCR